MNLKVVVYEMTFLSNIKKETHQINLGYSGSTCKNYRDNLLKKQEVNSRINSMLKDKIKKKTQFFLNTSELKSTNQTVDASHVIST